MSGFHEFFFRNFDIALRWYDKILLQNFTGFPPNFLNVENLSSRVGFTSFFFDIAI